MVSGENFNKFSKYFLSLFAIVGTIVTIITAQYSALHWYIVLSVVIAVSLVVLIVLYLIPKNSIPEGLEEIYDEIDNPKSKRPFKIVFPCDDNYYQAANAIAKEKFGKNTVGTKRANDWKKRNELLLTCLTDKNKMVGYFDILPLETNFAKELINGTYGEKDIKAENILGVHQMKKAEYIYFAGIAVKNTYSISGCIYANYLLHAAMLYIYFFYGESVVRKIITIPTSSRGLNIAQKWGFTLEREGSTRRDGNDLYLRDFDKNELFQIIKNKKQLYQRFDVNDYLIAAKELVDAKMKSPI